MVEEALLLGKLGEEVEGRLQVLLAAAEGDRRRQHQRVGLCRLADITHRHLVIARGEIAPGLGRVGDLLGDDEGDRAGITQHPVTFLILGPGRDLLPVGRLIRLADAFLRRDRSEFDADLAEVGRGIGLLGFEFLQLLGAAHIGVGVLDTVFGHDALPLGAPIGPIVGTAETDDFTFLARRLFQFGECLGTGRRGKESEAGRREKSEKCGPACDQHLE